MFKKKQPTFSRRDLTQQKKITQWLQPFIDNITIDMKTLRLHQMVKGAR